jgi:hypothetical protein
VGGFVLLQVAETPTQKRKRSTKAELAQRISVVYSLLCEGKSRANVIEIAAELWDVSERSADDYLAAARKMLEDDCRISREAFMAEALAGYRQIRESAFARGQLAVAKSCLDAQIDLVGLKA